MEDWTARKPERDADRLIGTIVAEKYRVQAMVARGGMGRIYRCEQLPLGRVVALKILTPRSGERIEEQAQKRFLLEATTCARLRHQNTVTVFDYGHVRLADEDVLYIVMEYIEGRTLSAALRQDGRFTVPRALRVAREILRSLKEAHKLGVVHRDLKPGNVMLTRTDDGEAVKVLDFGIAKVMATEQAVEQLTEEGNFVGSPKYMAPEQIQQGPIDARTDLYALGAVLFELLAGVPPFEGETAVQTLIAHVQQPAPSIADRSGVTVPPVVEQLVARLLSKKPEQRYADADATLRAIRAAAGPDEEADAQTEESQPMRRPKAATSLAEEPSGTMESGAPPARSRTPLVLGALVAVLLAVLLAGVSAIGVVVIGFGTTTAATAPPADPPALEPRTDPPTAPIPEPRVEPPAPKPSIAITSDPPGAEVWEGNRQLGVTPLDLDFGGTHTFTLKRDGYWDAEVPSAEVAGPQTLTATMVAKVAPPAADPPKKPKKQPAKDPPPGDDEEFRSNR